MYLTNSKDSVVQYNYCVGTGTSAIELNQTDNITVQYNEIYKTRQNAIAPDRNATNALIQYNYIDSCGDGILLCGFNYGSSVVRYNVIKDSESGKRYLNVHGDKGHQYIYNNIFYNSTSKAATFIASSGGSTYLGKSSNRHYIFNNIFYSPKAAARIDDGIATESGNLPNMVLPVRNGETATDLAGTTMQTSGTPDAGVLEFVSADSTKGGVVLHWIFMPMHSIRTNVRRRKNWERRLDYEKNKADPCKQKYLTKSACSLLLSRKGTWP